MFIPLHDANSLKHIRLQYVTIGLIAANAIVYLLFALAEAPVAEATAVALGYIPAVTFDFADLPPEIVLVPDSATYVTYAFLHGDVFHLAGNMVFLWVFGDNVEDALGHVKFLIFYLLCAAGAAWFHGILDPRSEIPLIGASGAIAGIVSAYLVLHPRVKIWVLAFMRIPLRIPAWIALALWIGFQFVMFLSAGEDQISWSAHVGGILLGAVLVPFLKRRDVPLFDRRIVLPEAVETGQPRPGAAVPRIGRDRLD